MKIGVVADTHISDNNASLPKELIEELKGVDMIIHAGDLVDLSVLDTLKSLCPNVKAVWGNMDPYDVKKKLPEQEIFQVQNFKIALTHGHGAPVGLIELLSKTFENENVDLVIFGHSHSACNEKKGETIYFNPGSPTDKVFAKFNSFGIIEIDDKIKARIIKINN